MYRLTPLLCTLIGVGASAVALPAGEMSWRMDRQRSTIDVAVHSTFNSFTCHVAHFEADLEMTDPHHVTRAVVSIGLAEIKTGRTQRDAHLLEWMGNNRFDRIVFALSDTQPSSEGGLVVHGRLSLHGVTKVVTFPARVLVEGQLQSIDGEALLNYRDFGLPVLRKFYVLKVDPQLVVRFHLQGWLELPVSRVPNVSPNQDLRLAQPLYWSPQPKPLPQAGIIGL